MLKVNNIVSGYQLLKVLKGITLHIKEGEIVSLIGNNGVGKTTLLKTIMGLIKLWEGHIYLKGKLLKKITPFTFIKNGIFFIREDGGLFEELSVKENLLLSWSISKKKKNFKRQLEYIFSIFPQIKEKMEEKVINLSGGERRMLSLLCGIISDPRLLLIDEPSLGLSPIFFKEILKRIKELNTSKNISFLIVDQNITEILKISHRYYLMNNGKIVMQGDSSTFDIEKVKKVYLSG